MIGRWIFLRDGRLSARTKLVLAALFVAALVIALPMRLALAWAAPRALTARTVEGTVWSGLIGDMRLGALPVGDVTAGLRPLPLLIARRELSVERLSPAGTAEFSAIVAGGSGWASLRDVQGQVPLGEGFGQLPATALGFRDFHFATEAGRCREADGQISLILAPLSELIPTPVALSGTARCDKGALYVPMSGPSGMEKLFVRLEPDG
ncbi:MAG TPA: type II secretion system protein N, partial [Novosphingobium sp.]|nr:type II secretion system protein N [Novosphingobium sp.]